MNHYTEETEINRKNKPTEYLRYSEIDTHEGIVQCQKLVRYKTKLSLIYSE